MSDPDRCYKLLDDLSTGEEDFMRKPLQVSLESIIEQIEKYKAKNDKIREEIEIKKLEIPDQFVEE